VVHLQLYAGWIGSNCTLVDFWCGTNSHLVLVEGKSKKPLPLFLLSFSVGRRDEKEKVDDKVKVQQAYTHLFHLKKSF
jgi:hypothetical protein